MINSLLKCCFLWLALGLALIPSALALEVDDPKYGFRFSLPDHFIHESNPKDPEVLHAYKRLPKEIGGLGTYVEAKALKGPIKVGQRLDPSKLQAEEGFNISFDQIEWQTHKLDVAIMKPKDPAKANIEIYTVLFPLSGQAIRFRVAGTSDADDPARAVFDRAVASFINTKPLAKEPERSELEKIGAWIFKLGLGIIIAVVLGRMLMRMAKGKPKKPKGPPPQAGPPMVRRPH